MRFLRNVMTRMCVQLASLRIASLMNYFVALYVYIYVNKNECAFM